MRDLVVGCPRAALTPRWLPAPTAYGCRRRCGPSLATLRRLKRDQEPSSPFVFTSERGAPFTTAGWRKMVARLGVAARLGFKAHPHMFRHTCGFQLANWAPTRAPCRRISAIATSSTPCATPNCRLRASRTSGVTDDCRQMDRRSPEIVGKWTSVSGKSLGTGSWQRQDGRGSAASRFRRDGSDIAEGVHFSPFGERHRRDFALSLP
jgi:Phage integrase family